MKASLHTRRKFIQFIAHGTVSLSALSLIPSCQKSSNESNIFPSFDDHVVLAPNLKYELIISWGDPISSDSVFGYNCDYIDIHPLSESELIMWVNHEYVNPLFVSSPTRNKKNIDKEQKLVGGSLIKLKKVNKDWRFVQGDPLNKALRADTFISFANGVKVRGSQRVQGTLANCAGGKTPWGTFLTCEENYDAFYGERNLKTGAVDTSKSKLHWQKFYPQNLPEHYGWVVEIDPFTGEAKKHTTLGRFAHESATTALSKKNKVVVYSGDDKNDQCLYKFISNSGSNFDKGVLYVANIELGKWLPLDLELSPILRKHFKNQLDLLIYARKASHILGATPLHRPEDIDINPLTKDIFIALTNNKAKGDFHGSILRITEDQQDHGALTFKSEVFKLGGRENGFSCPDNFVFDRNGNLWMATDISGQAIGKKPYQSFGNNAIFIIPSQGSQTGEVIQVASAPKDAEFTGLCFDEKQETLFVSVQHPGETTKNLAQPTSTWPTGTTPKPSVIALTGELLTSYTKALKPL